MLSMSLLLHRLFSFQILRRYLASLDNVFKLIISEILRVYKGLRTQWAVVILTWIVYWSLLRWVHVCVAMPMSFFVKKFIGLCATDVNDINDLLIDSEGFHPWKLLVFVSHHLNSGFSFLAYFSLCTWVFTVQTAKLLLNLAQAFISDILSNIMLNLVLDSWLVLIILTLLLWCVLWHFQIFTN